MVTTESIPNENRPVTGTQMIWAGGDSMATAAGRLQEWAAENNYDSIVGVRFMVESTVYADKVNFLYVAYGTCLRH